MLMCVARRRLRVRNTHVRDLFLFIQRFEQRVALDHAVVGHAAQNLVVGLGEATQVCEQTAPNSATLPSTLTDDGGGHGGPTQGMNSFKIGTSAEDAQNKVDSQAPPPPPDLELIPDEVQKPAADWTAFRVGVRYDPPLLALEWKGDGKTLRKDIPFPEVTELASLVAEVADDECAAAVLDHMVKTHGQQWLDFEKFFSKKQVLRLVDMVLQGGPDSVEM